MDDKLPKLALYQAELRPEQSQVVGDASVFSYAAQAGIAGETERSGNERQDDAGESRTSPKMPAIDVHPTFRGSHPGLRHITISADGQTAYVELTKGAVAVISAEDVRKVGRFSWCLTITATAWPGRHTARLPI